MGLRRGVSPTSCYLLLLTSSPGVKDFSAPPPVLSLQLSPHLIVHRLLARTFQFTVVGCSYPLPGIPSEVSFSRSSIFGQVTLSFLTFFGFRFSGPFVPVSYPLPPVPAHLLQRSRNSPLFFSRREGSSLRGFITLFRSGPYFFFSGVALPCWTN